MLIVAGPPPVHRWAWEVLTAPEVDAQNQSQRIVVTHIPTLRHGAPPRRPPHVTHAELTWVGARAVSQGDIPRYQVLGPVASQIMRRSSAIIPVAARTSASLADMQDLMDSFVDRSAFSICHLDTHGRTWSSPTSDPT